MQKTLKIILTFVLPLASVSIGLFKYFWLPSSSPKELDLLILFTLIIVPSLAATYNLLHLRHNLDAHNEKLKGAVEDIARDNKKFLDDINVLISETLSKSGQYFSLSSHRHKNTLTNFIPSFLEELNFKIKELSNGHLFENDPSKYQEFVTSIFNLAGKETTIKATSVVDPDGFWADENTINYLRNNKRLIDEKHVKIERYFYVNDDNKEQSKTAIANNIAIGVEVYIVDEKKLNNPRHIKDCGIIADYIAIVSEVDNRRNLYRVDAYIGDRKKFVEVKTIFDLLMKRRESVEEFYAGMTLDDFKKMADIVF